jgi:hypothetical protein
MRVVLSQHATGIVLGMRFSGFKGWPLTRESNDSIGDRS